MPTPEQIAQMAEVLGDTDSVDSETMGKRGFGG
jgi:hypothetical protein